ncbi:MAG: BPL-N domain-containing protein [Bdellovibrionia bacterium]
MLKQLKMVVFLLNVLNLSFPLRIVFAGNVPSSNTAATRQEKNVSRNPADIVCLYSGKGIHAAASDKLAAKLRREYDSQNVFEMTDPSYLQNFLKDNTENKVCFVIPGGNTTEVVKGMGEKKEAIFSGVKKSVGKGSEYVGICCGANLACRKLLWNASNPPMPYMKSDQLLGLLDADACFFSHEMQAAEGQEGKWVSIKETQPGTGGTKPAPYKVYWNRGSYYLNLSKDIEVVAKYQDATVPEAPGVICGKFGKGSVIACAVHPEISHHDANEVFQKSCSSPTLNEDMEKQAALFHKVFRKSK